MKEIQQVKDYIATILIDKSHHTYRSYYNAIDKLFEFLEINDFNDIEMITPSDIRKYQKHLKDTGMQESSVNTNIRPIRAMFNWMAREEYILKSPMATVKDLKTKKKAMTFLSEEEQVSIVQSCSNITDKAMIVVILMTGMRRDEFCQLKLSDYNGTHILIHGKGNKERVLALHPLAKEILDEYLIFRNKKYGNKSDFLFVTRYGTGFKGDTVYDRVKSILMNAGISRDRIDQIHPHTLRHSFVANMLEAGADIFVCQMALGHSDIRTTMKYSHLHASTLDNALKNQKVIL